MANKQQKISEIRKAGVIGKPLTANVTTIDKEKARVKLKQGKDIIFAYAEKDKPERAKEFLKHVKEFEGKTCTFPGKTFVAKKVENKQYLPRGSTTNYKLIVQKVPNGTKLPSRDSSGIVQAIKKIEGQNSFEQLTINDVYIKSGTVYRYWGCSNCSKKAEYGSALKKCKGIRCKTETVGQQNSRNEKICMMLKNLTIVGGKDLKFTIEGITVGHFEATRFLGKEGGEFNSDYEAQKYFEDDFLGFKISLELSRKTSKNSKFRPSPFASNIQKQRARKSFAKDEPEDMKPRVLLSFEGQIELQNEAGPLDDTEATFNSSQKKKKKQTIKLPILDVKLKTSPEDIQKSIIAKQIFSSTYKLPKQPRGLVLIINNRFTNDPVQFRAGSDIDVENLIELFQQLGFDLFENRCRQDVKDKEELTGIIQDFKSSLVTHNYASFFFIIMSHGSMMEVSLEGEDSKSNTAHFFEDIVLHFSDTKFPHFKGKPKIFIDASCQNNDISPATKNLKLTNDTLTDTLICLAASPGFNSQRVRSSGSVFVYFLVATMIEHASILELQEILKETQRNIQTLKLSWKQKLNLDITIPVWWTNLFDQFYFFPKDEDFKVSDDRMDVG